VLDAEWLCANLQRYGISFYAGVPDSVLQPFCSYVDTRSDGLQHIVAANEGGAVALAAGYHLATGMVGLVYMQNSGLGNALNPLLSLVDRETYAIPMVLLIGWRGKPGSHDEPQHLKQGRITGSLLDVMGIPWRDLGNSEESASQALVEMATTLNRDPGPFALVVAGKAFSSCPSPGKAISDQCFLSRENAIEIILDNIPNNSAVIGSTGMISRELFELRIRQDDEPSNFFMNVGAMGHVSQISAAIAISQPTRTVVCLEGDGSLLMHLGSLGTITHMAPKNFIHVVLNNQSHDSVGGQATANPALSLSDLAKQAGYKFTVKVENETSLRNAIAECQRHAGPVMIESMVRRGARKGLGRPGSDLLTFKDNFMRFLNGT